MAEVLHTGDPLEALQLVDEDPASGGTRRGRRAVVTVAPARGGMITRFVVTEPDDTDVPVLYLDEATLRDPSKSVRGGIPILFPIAGKLPDDEYEVGGRAYSMKQHGFARNLPWSILATGTDDGAFVTLGLEANEGTRKQYPFEFALRFTYRLRGTTLYLEQSFENRGKAAMPIQPGLHPYFEVKDSTKASARVETDATRVFDNVTKREGTLKGEIALAGSEVDLHLLDPRRRDTLLRRPGLPAVHLAYGQEQSVLVVWTLPDRDFVCVEPWRAKFGALADGTAPRVPPGRSVATTLTLRLVE